MSRILPPLLLAPLLAAACAKAPAPESAPAPVAAVPVDACEAVRERILAEPDLRVDQPPVPVEMKPALFQRPPRTALRRDGSAEVKADIVIDTLGRADVRSLKVISTSHVWFVNDLRRVLPQWKFTPAALGSCKVPGIYHVAGGIRPRPAAPPARSGGRTAPAQRSPD